uniref:Uncharacterized protein n=1 Tax=Panagrolaimus davidi TaxID=227884 RepID=A0A914QBM3_9BILA
MDSTENVDVFKLENLPLMIRTRFFALLPYFVQIEMAQTNNHYYNIYENYFSKREITERVDIVVEDDNIVINGKKYASSLFENEKSVKYLLKLDDFPTKYLSISTKTENPSFDIGILAKEFAQNGVYFTKINEKKAAFRWLNMSLKSHKCREDTQIKLGWEPNKEKTKVFLWLTTSNQSVNISAVIEFQERREQVKQESDQAEPETIEEEPEIKRCCKLC